MLKTRPRRCTVLKIGGNMSKRYGLIIETKDEGPLIWEGKPMDIDAANTKMKYVKSWSNVIRVAVFEMAYMYGNETLIPEAEE
jgi:hypothetical protein